MPPRGRPPGASRARRGLRAAASASNRALSAFVEEDLSVLQPPTKRLKKTGTIACGRCKLPPSEAEWAFFDDDGNAVGNACKSDWKAYVVGYKKDRTWEDHCDRCEADADYNDEVEIASNVAKGGGVQPWQQSSVTDGETYELVTTRSFVGLSRAEFTSVAGGCPSHHSIVETDMPNELNGNYKGVLMVNPLRPYVQYDLVHRRTIGKTRMVLEAKDEVRNGLAVELHADAKEARDKQAFMTKLRNCTLTAHELDENVGKPAFADFFGTGGSTGKEAPTSQVAMAGKQALTGMQATTFKEALASKQSPNCKRGSELERPTEFSCAASEASGVSAAALRRMSSRTRMDAPLSSRSDSPGLKLGNVVGSTEDRSHIDLHKKCDMHIDIDMGINIYINIYIYIYICIKRKTYSCICKNI